MYFITSVDSRLMTYCAIHMASSIQRNSIDMHLGTNNTSCRKKTLRCTIGLRDTLRFVRAGIVGVHLWLVLLKKISFRIKEVTCCTSLSATTMYIQV